MQSAKLRWCLRCGQVEIDTEQRLSPLREGDPNCTHHEYWGRGTLAKCTEYFAGALAIRYPARSQFSVNPAKKSRQAGQYARCRTCSGAPSTASSAPCLITSAPYRQRDQGHNCDGDLYGFQYGPTHSE
jgi:hypothetical protein